MSTKIFSSKLNWFWDLSVVWFILLKCKKELSISNSVVWFNVLLNIEYALCLYAEKNAGKEVDQLLEIIESETFKRVPSVGQKQIRDRYE